ncbi:hypothetical protein [Erwinia aphidicola]|uniref:hypothetical protein n=1 Tax=Erwinia aphidicola TaxID=68334 RepID=UPI00209DA90E|nr:hypothetical protein [Erwinia aphidicola]MCP2231514.1 hypothetical protein [Erwinia aphidicola]
MQKIKEYLALAMVMCVPYLIVMADNYIFKNEVNKHSITAISHSVFLIINIILLYKIKDNNRDLSGGILLIIGLFAAMFIRENRENIRDLFNGALHWSWLAIAISVSYLWQAAQQGIRKALRNLVELHRFGDYNYLICGLILVLVWSRLFGNRYLWKGIANIHYSEALKNTAEEPTQSLGYLIIMYGLVKILRSK